MDKKNEDYEMITRVEADQITDIELQNQLYKHIQMLMDKLHISEEEAGKLLDVDEENLLSLRFNAFMVDNIKELSEKVVDEYIEKNGLKEKK